MKIQDLCLRKRRCASEKPASYFNPTQITYQLLNTSFKWLKDFPASQKIRYMHNL